jgi:glycosyltransferase involved in cell wall biosynthesis
MDVPSIDRAAFSGSIDLSPLHIDSNHRVVGMVANLRKQKNPTMFVEAMAPILRRLEDVRGLIVGQPVSDEPDVAEKIQSTVSRFNVDGKIVLAGSRTDVPSLMKRMTVFCLTSDYEGMPNVVLEAMATGRPVVATEVGDVPKLVRDGVNGFLVKAGDSGEFTRRVERLLLNGEMATQMGLAGRDMVQSAFACDRAAQKLTRLYCDTLLESKSSQRI